MRTSRMLPLFLAIVACFAAGPADAGTTARLYLLGTEQGEPYWSSDLDDPELRAAEIACGGYVTNANTPNCLRAGGGANFLYFAQGALLDQPLALSAGRPVRFHFAVSVISDGPYTVHLALQRGTTLARSGPATEVAPGVYEGNLEATGTLDTARYTYLGVEVRSSDPLPRLEVKTAGRSWVELPDAVSMRGVPELRAEDGYRPSPSSLFTDERSFRFNDGDYVLHSFDVAANARTIVSVEAAWPSAALYAWAEGYATPTAYDALRREGTDWNGPTDHMRVKMSVDGAEMAFGAYGSLAEIGVPAGELEFEFNPYMTHRTGTVKAYVLQLFGERTLESMRWRFYPLLSRAYNLPSTAICFRGTEQIAATPALRTFSVSLGWDSPNPTPQRWTIAYSVPGVGDAPCGGISSGTEMRFTHPGPGIWWVGPTPSRTDWFVSAYDVRFESEVRFTYSS